jgi:hypothetical protein
MRCPFCFRDVRVDESDCLAVHSVIDNAVLLLSLVIRAFGGEKTRRIVPALPMDKCIGSGAKVTRKPKLRLVP